MKSKGLSLFFVLTVVLSGCASGHVHLVDGGTVFIERVPAKKVYFSRVYVNQDGNELVIAGRLKQRYRSHVGSGHVDIAILNPAGEILGKGSAFYVPGILSAKRSRHRGSRFEVRLPVVPPEGSKVRLEFHRTMKSVNRTFNCDENAVLPGVGS